MEQVADYPIVREMRVGNHGTMYVARPPARLGISDEFVAIKLLDHQASADEFRRIANELRLLNSTQSPFIARLLDAGNQAGRLFLVMTYYAEGSIEDAYGRLAPELVMQLVADTARGAHELHELGVAHRDIKPANVLIDRGRGVLADLGLAQLLGSSTTTIGHGPLGALEFMSPQLVWGNKASRRSDIHSLAATLHRALTGESLVGELDTSSLLQAIRHVMHAEPVIAPNCPDRIRPVLTRAIHDDHGDPYATAADFAADLEALIPKGAV